jgi:hypothetical protein
MRQSRVCWIKENKLTDRRTYWLLAVVSVIDRVQLVVVQQFAQLPGVNAVVLVAFLQQGIPTRIANHHFPDMGAARR